MDPPPLDYAASVFAGLRSPLGARVGQLIADALVDGAPLPSWGALPDASAD